MFRNNLITVLTVVTTVTVITAVSTLPNAETVEHALFNCEKLVDLALLKKKSRCITSL